MRAARDDADPTALLRATGVVGGLAEDVRFVEPFVTALAQLRRDGARAVVQRLVDERN